jgi:Sulfatase
MANRPRNVFLIVADSLRYDAVQPLVGTAPSYMEDHAMRFTNARSAACWTLPATVSLFSGLMPHEHGATTQSRWFDDKIPSLAGKLKNKGYKPIMVTANSVTTEVFNVDKDFDEVHKIWLDVQSRHPMMLRLVLTFNRPRIRRMVLKPKDDLFFKLSEDLTQGIVYAQSTCRDLFDKTRQRMQQENAKGQGCFFFLNLMETHYPYHISDTFELLSRNIRGKMREWHTLYHLLSQSFLKTEDEIIKQDMLDLFRERQRKSWQLVKPLLDAFIEEIHKDKDNLVVFCSDHGDNFGDQGWQYHFSNVTDAGNRVPLYWLDHQHSAPTVLDHKVSSRFIHQSIMKACGDDTISQDLFEESDTTIPILQSFWYNNEGLTLPKYKYNQICFVEGDQRYVNRAGEWLQAPVGTTGAEPIFQKIGTQTNPLEELKLSAERRAYMQQVFGDFSTFSEQIMNKKK